MVTDKRGVQLPHCPEVRGYNVMFHNDPNTVNHCPACGRSHWIVGRALAECAFCSTALPIENPPSWGSSIVRTITQKDRDRLLAA